MKCTYRLFFVVAVLILLSGTVAYGHFGMVIPSANNFTQDKRTAELKLSFSHPFELAGMDLVRPASFYVTMNGKKQELGEGLKANQIMGRNGWHIDYTFKRPGVYNFIMEPTPYWEPAEDVFIIHYTKTTVSAFGDDQGWDEPVGLPAEIVPLTRPFGNYVGNTISGQVLTAGKPAASVEVEVELYDSDKRFNAPTEHHITQVVKTDSNGVFHFTCSQPGWWGFSALTEADYTLKNPEGEDKGVEIGAVLWVYLDSYLTK